MSVIAKCLIEPILVPATVTTAYTAPIGTRTIIDKFTATNTSGGAVSLTIYLVAGGGSAGPVNLLLSAVSIAAGAVYISNEMPNQILNAGDSIQVIASAALSISIRASGREVQ